MDVGDGCCVYLLLHRGVDKDGIHGSGCVMGKKQENGWIVFFCLPAPLLGPRARNLSFRSPRLCDRKFAPLSCAGMLNFKHKQYATVDAIIASLSKYLDFFCFLGGAHLHQPHNHRGPAGKGVAALTMASSIIVLLPNVSSTLIFLYPRLTGNVSDSYSPCVVFH